MESDNVKDIVKDSQKDREMSDTTSFIRLKGERIAVASYRVTDFLPDSEPLKWKIRDHAGALVTLPLSKIEEHVTALHSLYTMASEASLWRGSNFTILADECVALRQLVLEEAKPYLMGGGAPVTITAPRAPKKIIHASTHSGDGARAEKVLTVLKEKGASGISTIAAALPDVSEKTVQRQLNSLVEKGLVLKDGERRWSRYSAL